MLAPATAATLADRYGWKPVFYVPPTRHVDPLMMQLQGATGGTVPNFTIKVKSALTKTTYIVNSVGSDPHKKGSTTVQYVPLALRVHFSDGTVLDPTKPGCNDTQSVVKRFYNSPLFNNVPLTSNGVNVGTTQVIDGFQRAEYWKYTKGSNYHLLLSPSVKKPIVVDITAPSGSLLVAGGCSGNNHDLGIINPNAWDSIVIGLANKYAKTTQLPLAMAYNVVLGYSSSQCCIIGYHSGYSRSGGTQTYAVGAYTDPGIFSPGVQDIHAWTHEIGEWANDPFVNNATPAWGHVGQVSGCQNNFEVGDPLTGTPFIVNYKGFTYHPQELAFISWFYRTSTDWGTGGKYSFEGTFTSTQPLCT
ncbi:MAG: hypothetical protein JO060_06410 [Candidatus Eremiobacteraeota bacterium]|nr:hypothetical protein [Candidatus Eremiobacteraeota bacterium]MBV9648226.1 hypothetical protein [Candidatus Eremiobacteraeota bacterium]